MGNVHARHYHNIPGVELFAFDRDPEKLEAFCRHHEATSIADWDEFLARVSIVDICLPTNLHLDFALKSIAAGRPTLVEKPMARKVDDCRKMIDAAREAKVLLSVGHVARFFPEYQKAHELIASGAIGTPSLFRMHRGGSAPVGSDSWFRNHDLSGGVLLDLAVHDFDWLNWTVGHCTEVFAKSVRTGKHQDGNFIGDYALTTLKYASGAIAHVESTWMDPSGFRTSLEVTGSEGMIEFDSRTNPAVRMLVDHGHRADSLMSPNDDPYCLELKAFLAAVDGKKELAVTPEEGLEAVAIAEAALQSAQSGQPVDPQNLLATLCS